MKLSQSKTLTGVLLALFFAASCEDPIEIPVNVNLGVSPKEVTIPADGGRATVSFSSPLAWEASSTADWLKISPASGEAGDKIVLTLSATANESTDQRTANVTVKVKDYQFQETVKVLQTGAEPPFVPMLEVSKTSFSVEAAGGEISFSVTANTDWTALADANWLTLRTASGKEGTTTVVAIVSGNDDTKARSANITVSCADIRKSVKVDQSGADVWTEITGFRGSIEDWADGGEITIPSGSQNPAVQEDTWQVYMPVEEKLIDMTKAEDGLLTAEIMEHYPNMSMFLMRGGKDVFGSVYYRAFIPVSEGVYTSALALTTSLTHSLYVPVDGPVAITLDPVALTASFREIPQEWKTIGRCQFTDGFITDAWELEMGPMDVEIQKKGVIDEYRLVNPYSAMWEAYPEEFEYREGGELIIRIKEDGTAYFKETFTGVILPEYGPAWVMSAVPEEGWSSYSYYGTWDQASSAAIFDQPGVIYLEGVGKYYLTNRSGQMKIVIPVAN